MGCEFFLSSQPPHNNAQPFMPPMDPGERGFVPSHPAAVFGAFDSPPLVVVLPPGVCVVPAVPPGFVLPFPPPPCIPEPSSILLCASTLLLAGLAARRKRAS